LGLAGRKDHHGHASIVSFRQDPFEREYSRRSAGHGTFDYGND
jgi:hypothetical protein